MNPSEAALPYLAPDPDNDETRTPKNLLARHHGGWKLNLGFAVGLVVFVSLSPWGLGWSILAFYVAAWSVMVWVVAHRAWRDVKAETGDAWYLIPRRNRMWGYTWIVVTAPVSAIAVLFVKARRRER